MSTLISTESDSRFERLSTWILEGSGDAPNDMIGELSKVVRSQTFLLALEEQAKQFAGQREDHRVPPLEVLQRVKTLGESIPVRKLLSTVLDTVGRVNTKKGGGKNVDL